MTDIVERLRRLGACEPGCGGRCTACPDTVASEAADEIERLSKYETTVRRIAWDYIELSYDKAYNQRDEYIRWCRTTIQKDKDRHD